ncbi:SusC/RagA family TonB-linked outer membrane protein [Chitinophaga nivalis]|uniref:TonB-dependent receptor n=1 Tax=Chitinophaga nivalis TaxID=2991709 RepID=A0ABT3IGC2_9BACT|nr:TonB-dependent receptor [Chitinophaga nivalis]MCW3467316.1 TonB-dependent receptor [Chitinophaga nivalis]MCW3482992.1 TonB-dependent receptor [Chitinophaga nivalis]
MKNVTSFAVLLCLAVYGNTLRAQQRDFIITGKVTGKDNNEPAIGATITIKGKATGVTAGTDGSYRLKLTPADSIIVISHIGSHSRELKITRAGTYDIALTQNDRQISEIVVTGYSTQNKRFIAGAISTVSGESIKNIPAAGFNQLLQGKTTGIQVSGNSGVPGGGVFIRVRGTNSVNAGNDPLYIVDGVFISSSNLISTGMGRQAASNPLADLNPADIENIQILKDANATAIYGSLGANGVILVTTKRGKLNTRSKVAVNVSHGWADAPKKFQVTTGPETGLLTNEYTLNTAIDNKQDPATVTLPFPRYDTLPTYDRIRDVFRTAANSNYEVSVAGGTAKNSYYIGFGYLKQESVVKPSGFQRYSGRFNFDTHITDRLKAGTSTSIARAYRNVSSNDNNPIGVINSALFPRSYLRIYNPDGTYAKYGNFDNHIALINNLDNNAVTWRVITNLYAEYAILPQLKLRSSWSLDYNDLSENNYSNTLISDGTPNGSAYAGVSKNIAYQNEQVLTYIQSFGAGEKHTINALIGNTIKKDNYQRSSASGTGFATNSLKDISVAAIQTGSSQQSAALLLSFFGKASYTFDNKYTIDGSLRADGSSRFGVNHRWGYFPSGGFTWQLGQEPFIQQLHLFDQLKVRASVGLSGNQSGIDNYGSLGLWSSGSNYLQQPGTAPSQLANPDLTWETTRQTDIGVEFSVLHNRLNIAFDYYNKYTYDLLLNVPVPTRSGYTSYLQNYGAMSNKGLELSINSVNISGKNFRWTTDFNISANKNRIEKLASDIPAGSRNIVLLKEGQSLYSFWLFKQQYVDPQTGNAVYEDLNNDKRITLDDRQIIGSAWPDFTGGLTNNFSYKGFDLSFLIYFQQGNKIMNMNDFFLVHGGTQRNIGFIPRQLERWQHPGDITDIPRMTSYSGNIDQNNSPANNYGGNVQNLSSRYLQDGSFIRLRNISLGYTIPTAVTARWGISSLRAYVQASNLFTITGYRGLDPEVSSQSADQNTPGFDWATVPQPRTVQVGLNVSF